MQKTPHTSKRITLVSREDYEVDLEYNSEFAIIHLPYVDRFNKSVYLDMVTTLNSIQEFLSTVGYPSLWVAVVPTEEATAKLAKKMMFEYRGSDQGYDVYERTL